MTLHSYLDPQNPFQFWAFFLVLSVVNFAILLGIKKAATSRFRGLTSEGLAWAQAPIAIAQGTRKFFLLAAAFFLAAQIIPIPVGQLLVQRLSFLALIFQVGIWGSMLIHLWIERVSQANVDDGAKTTTIRAIGFLGRLVFFSTLLLWALANFGIDISTLITGLGVGGIAVALAVQNILGDLFASLTIVLDKPFVIGDSIVVGEYSGTIEHIGLKTTRLRSQSGEQLIFPNANLLQSRIRNFKRMRERRAFFELGVTYETPLESLRNIPENLRKIIEAHSPRTRFERAHLKKFGPYSLDYEVVYWVLDPDYGIYMDIQQQINLEILAYFERSKIEFAYPTQTVISE